MRYELAGHEWTTIKPMYLGIGINQGSLGACEDGNASTAVESAGAVRRRFDGRWRFYKRIVRYRCRQSVVGTPCRCLVVSTKIAHEFRQGFRPRRDSWRTVLLAEAGSAECGRSATQM